MTQQSSSEQGEIARRDVHRRRSGTLGLLGVTFFVVSAAAQLTDGRRCADGQAP